MNQHEAEAAADVLARLPGVRATNVRKSYPARTGTDWEVALEDAGVGWLVLQTTEGVSRYAALRLAERVVELTLAARAVIKWKGSPDTPWHAAVARLEALLDEKEDADG